MEGKFKIMLNDIRNEKGLSWLEMEETTGIPMRTLLSIQQNQSTTFKTLDKICVSLKVDITDIIRLA